MHIVQKSRGWAEFCDCSTEAGKKTKKTPRLQATVDWVPERCTMSDNFLLSDWALSFCPYHQLLTAVEPRYNNMSRELRNCCIKTPDITIWL